MQKNFGAGGAADIPIIFWERLRPQKTWWRLMDENQLSKVVQGVRFQNGIEIIEMPAHHAA